MCWTEAGIAWWDTHNMEVVGVAAWSPQSCSEEDHPYQDSHRSERTVKQA